MSVEGEPLQTEAGEADAVPALGVPEHKGAVGVQVKIPVGFLAAFPPVVIKSVFVAPAVEETQPVPEAFVRLLKSAFVAPRNPT